MALSFKLASVISNSKTPCQLWSRDVSSKLKEFEAGEGKAQSVVLMRTRKNESDLSLSRQVRNSTDQEATGEVPADSALAHHLPRWEGAQCTPAHTGPSTLSGLWSRGRWAQEAQLVNS